MPIGNVPLASQLPVSGSVVAWTAPWANWFTQIHLALFGWRKSYYGTAVINFGSISANAELTATATVTGARSGDSVIVTPSAAVAGVFFDGTVTADSTVTIRAGNFTGLAVNPASLTFHITVLQQ